MPYASIRSVIGDNIVGLIKETILQRMYHGQIYNPGWVFNPHAENLQSSLEYMAGL